MQNQAPDTTVIDGSNDAQADAQAQQAAADAAFIAAYPMAIASFFEPGKGFTLGIAPRGAKSVDQMVANIRYEDLAVAERDLDTILQHVRRAILMVVQNNGYVAGRNDALAQMGAANDTKDPTKGKVVNVVNNTVIKAKAKNKPGQSKSKSR